MFETLFCSPVKPSTWKLSSNIVLTLTISVCRFEDLEKERLLEYILQLSFAAHYKALIEEINSNNCCGCQREDPSPIEHDCQIKIGMDPWFDYYDEALKKLSPSTCVTSCKKCMSRIRSTFCR